MADKFTESMTFEKQRALFGSVVLGRKRFNMDTVQGSLIFKCDGCSNHCAYSWDEIVEHGNAGKPLSFLCGGHCCSQDFATPRQLDFLESLGGDISEPMSKKEASARIQEKLDEGRAEVRKAARARREQLSQEA